MQLSQSYILTELTISEPLSLSFWKVVSSVNTHQLIQVAFGSPSTMESESSSFP